MIVAARANAISSAVVESLPITVAEVSSIPRWPTVLIAKAVLESYLEADFEGGCAISKKVLYVIVDTSIVYGFEYSLM